MHDSMSQDESAAIAFARAVLADYRAALASAPLTAPPGREWMFRLADALGSVLDDQADEDQDDQADDLDDETYFCSTCGGTISIFIGHGDGWQHYRGQGTAASPVELYDAGHEATFAVVAGGAR